LIPQEYKKTAAPPSRCGGFFSDKSRRIRLPTGLVQLVLLDTYRTVKMFTTRWYLGSCVTFITYSPYMANKGPISDQNPSHRGISVDPLSPTAPPSYEKGRQKLRIAWAVNPKGRDRDLHIFFPSESAAWLYNPASGASPLLHSPL
jgi:hypothetical protein